MGNNNQGKDIYIEAFFAIICMLKKLLYVHIFEKKKKIYNDLKRNSMKLFNWMTFLFNLDNWNKRFKIPEIQHKLHSLWLKQRHMSADAFTYKYYIKNIHIMLTKIFIIYKKGSERAFNNSLSQCIHSIPLKIMNLKTFTYIDIHLQGK